MNLKKLPKLLFFALVFLQFQANTYAAEVIITSPISSSVTYSGPDTYKVNGDLVINTGVILTIDGTVLKLETGKLILNGTGNYNLISGGQLIQPTIVISPISSDVTYSGPNTYLVDGPLVVNAGTSLTISGTALTVRGKLTLNGNVYLRNGGQLFQSTTGVSTNDGTGFLSVYQEGTVDKFGVNYWCSPIGAITDSSGNNPFNIELLGQPLDDTNSFFTPPLTTATDGISDPLQIAAFWVDKFVSSGTYGEWVDVGTGTLLPGEGFTMKGTGAPLDLANNNAGGTAQRYDFRGKPNNGDISTAIAPDKFTLIGNPYPSAIDLDAFFDDDDNLDTDQIAYFWEQGSSTSHKVSEYVGGYGFYAPYGFEDEPGNYIPATFFNYNGDGTLIPGSACPTCNSTGNPHRRYAPIGQGFMVKGDPNFIGDNKVVMKNSFRVYEPEGAANGSVFSKKQGETAQNKLPQIRFNTTYDNGPIGQILQVFEPQATTGFDKRKDVINPNQAKYPTQVNFLVGGKRCAISAAPFDINRKIPLIFNNKAQANYKMTVQEMVNLDEVTNVYLHDKVADKYYDIKNDFYAFTLPAGQNYTQYEITFQNPGNLGVDDLTEKSFGVFQNNETKRLIVSNPLQKELVSCDLYDIAGKLIFSKKQLGIQPSYEFSTDDLRDGIYIVRVTSQDGKTKGQKIIVRN